LNRKDFSPKVLIKMLQKTNIMAIFTVCFAFASFANIDDVKTSPSKSIAVMELSVVGATKDEASVIYAGFCNELVKSRLYTVVEREKMDEILKEHAFAQSGVVSEKNAAKAGELIGAQKMVTGTLSKLDNGYILSIRLIDVTSGTIEKSVQKEVEGTIADFLALGIPDFVRQLAGIESDNTATILEYCISQARSIANEMALGMNEKCAAMPCADKAARLQQRIATLKSQCDLSFQSKAVTKEVKNAIIDGFEQLADAVSLYGSSCRADNSGDVDLQRRKMVESGKKARDVLKGIVIEGAKEK
jgi:Curli production assembly/transport component CsgG.